SGQWRRGVMKRRSQIPEPSGFARAESIEPRVVQAHPDQTQDLRDLVSIGHFLAPEMHRHGGVDEAASAGREWAGGGVEMVAAAQLMARRRHPDGSAGIPPP